MGVAKMNREEKYEGWFTVRHERCFGLWIGGLQVVHQQSGIIQFTDGHDYHFHQRHEKCVKGILKRRNLFKISQEVQSKQKIKKQKTK